MQDKTPALVAISLYPIDFAHRRPTALPPSLPLEIVSDIEAEAKDFSCGAAMIRRMLPHIGCFSWRNECFIMNDASGCEEVKWNLDRIAKKHKRRPRFFFMAYTKYEEMPKYAWYEYKRGKLRMISIHTVCEGFEIHPSFVR